MCCVHIVKRKDEVVVVVEWKDEELEEAGYGLRQRHMVERGLSNPTLMSRKEELEG